MGDHLDKIPCAVLYGKPGWRSGHQSRLPPLLQKMFVCGLSFSRSQPDFEGFLRALRFPPSSKLTPSLFQFDRMQDLPENHFRVSGASWVNIIHYYYYYRHHDNVEVASFCIWAPMRASTHQVEVKNPCK